MTAKTLTLTHADRTTTVRLSHNINAVGKRYHIPERRMRDAMRRVGITRWDMGIACETPHAMPAITHSATRIFSYHGGWYVSFEPREAR